jgi:hypothetical protein
MYIYLAKCICMINTFMRINTYIYIHIYICTDILPSLWSDQAVNKLLVVRIVFWYDLVYTPPIDGKLSKQVTLWPSLVSSFMTTSPEDPAPMTHICFLSVSVVSLLWTFASLLDWMHIFFAYSNKSRLVC